jgi:nitrogen fixation/metabolism regulation signal transduction histidine kinase
MKNMGIKLKLIFLFIVIKCIPLIIIGYLAIIGVNELEKYFSNNTKILFEENKKLIESTASNAIEDSIKALDKTSQNSLEKLSVSIANQVADFLYERDNDLLFLSKLALNDKVLQEFSNSKQKKILSHDKYIYDDVTNSWIPPKLKTQKIKGLQQSSIEDNNKEFHVVDPLVLQSKYIPLYKEISFFDTDGKEIYKTSSINEKKLDISKQKNTYIKAEDYFSKIKNLKAGEIYVSDVIGAYVPSKVIGSFTKEKAKKMGVDFKPELHGYAGVENPNGKHFEGIIRFITPVYKKNKKIGYISLALDHRHIMEYTDTINPVDPQIKQNIANARDGNYLFMWDKEGRNISHPRDYFIMGFDPKTGKRVPGWLSKSVLEDFKKSKKSDLNSFLETYPTFYKQSLQQKPNLAQLKEKGEVGLDCRYLNFAPQCKGWMEITQNGGYGSFVIYWSKVWKLTTAATIPYYTGQYGSSKRGFGFVTMGANVDEFHEAANKTKENINNILDEQNKKLQNAVEHSSKKIEHLTQKIVNELTSVTFLMVILVILIAIWMSNYITSKIQKLIEGTQKFDNNNLDYRIEVTSKDEIGQLEKAFNKMASRIEQSIKIQKEKEAQVIQKTKMASMGDMLSAIIHQWKQPLSVIKTKVSGTQLHIEMEQEIKKDELVDVLDSVNRQVDYMTEITSEFKDFFKPTQKQIYTLNDVIYSTYQMLSGIYKSKGILIEIDGDKDIKIDGYPNELMQVLINILNNASDQIRQNDVPHKVININMESNETVVFIKISDSAGGISENIIDKIFDSYFTTKDSDHGTGIGLDIAVQIITKAQGKISVKNITKNVEGVDYTGAEFTIELPLS